MAGMVEKQEVWRESMSKKGSISLCDNVVEIQEGLAHITLTFDNGNQAGEFACEILKRGLLVGLKRLEWKQEYPHSQAVKPGVERIAELKKEVEDATNWHDVTASVFNAYVFSRFIGENDFRSLPQDKQLKVSREIALRVLEEVEKYLKA